MNCCDDYGNCNQGRDCPVRVAKAKPVMRAADPLPPSTWREALKKAALGLLLSFFGVIWLSTLVYATYSLTA